jgi:hypothetical protein
MKQHREKSMKEQVEIIADGTNRLLLTFPESTNGIRMKSGTKVSFEELVDLLRNGSPEVEGQGCTCSNFDENTCIIPK